MVLKKEDKRMNKIKPCPFCGTKVGLSKIPLWQGSHGYINCFEVKIVCPKCGCNVTYNENDTIYRTKEEAYKNVIEAWNKRDESNITTQQQPCPVQPKTGQWKKMVSVYDVIEGKYILIPYTHKDEGLNNTPLYVCDCGNVSTKPTNYCPDCGTLMQAESEE